MGKKFWLENHAKTQRFMWIGMVFITLKQLTNGSSIKLKMVLIQIHLSLWTRLVTKLYLKNSYLIYSINYYYPPMLPFLFLVWIFVVGTIIVSKSSKAYLDPFVIKGKKFPEIWNTNFEERVYQFGSNYIHFDGKMYEDWILLMFKRDRKFLTWT